MSRRKKPRNGQSWEELAANPETPPSVLYHQSLKHPEAVLSNIALPLLQLSDPKLWADITGRARRAIADRQLLDLGDVWTRACRGDLDDALVVYRGELAKDWHPIQALLRPEDMQNPKWPHLRGTMAALCAKGQARHLGVNVEQFQAEELETLLDQAHRMEADRLASYADVEAARRPRFPSASKALCARSKAA